MKPIPFSSLNLTSEIQRATHAMGFENATEIQAKTIPLILEGKDVIGRSQTGTGKTASFAIPAVEMIDVDHKFQVQVLVVCPTRELAIQSWGEFKKLYQFKSGIKAAVVYGGQPIDRQIKELKKGVNIVIGTPGRIMDHLRRKTLKLNHLKMVILDEADEMLNMGFREDIETILSQAPEERQTVFFCATMPPEIMAITKTYQKHPELVEINRNQVTLEAISQYYFETSASGKQEALAGLLKSENPGRAIVFCNTQKMVDGLVIFLVRQGFEAVGIHGRITQNVRTRVMEKFKAGRVPILVATDVAARGIDAQDVEMVVNFDIPADVEDYIHRIGRTGRAGKSGKAYTIISGRKQILQLRNIERVTKSSIIREEVRTGGIVQRQKPDSAEVSHPEKDRKRRKAVIDFAREFSPSKRERPSPKDGSSRIILNIGKMQHISPNHIVGAIAEKTSLSGSDIGKIQVLDNSTIVEIPGAQRQEVIDSLKGQKIKGMFVDAKPHDREEPRRAPSGYASHRFKDRQPGRRG
ncbi:MAG TPA: DEAD/DEAH box helicase [Clostridia bacterium]|nr:DEAD/DEAH box helicase [Clostridia bacterium]